MSLHHASSSSAAASGLHNSVVQQLTSPANELRGILLKEEKGGFGLTRSWAKKIVVADNSSIRYYTMDTQAQLSAHAAGDVNSGSSFSSSSSASVLLESHSALSSSSSAGRVVPPLHEPPRKTLPFSSLKLTARLPPDSRSYKEHAFQLVDVNTSYSMTLSASSEAEHELWTNFLDSRCLGGGRSHRLNPLIESEIVSIKKDMYGEVGPPINNAGASFCPPSPTASRPAAKSFWGVGGGTDKAALEAARHTAAQERDKNNNNSSNSSNSSSSSNNNHTHKDPKRRLFGSKVYDLFLIGSSLALKSENLEDLLLHLDLSRHMYAPVGVPSSDDAVRGQSTSSGNAGAAPRSSSPSGPSAHALVAALDPSGSGYISKEAFLDWYERVVDEEGPNAGWGSAPAPAAPPAAASSSDSAISPKMAKRTTFSKPPLPPPPPKGAPPPQAPDGGGGGGEQHSPSSGPVGGGAGPHSPTGGPRASLLPRPISPRPALPPPAPSPLAPAPINVADMVTVISQFRSNPKLLKGSVAKALNAMLLASAGRPSATFEHAACTFVETNYTTLVAELKLALGAMLETKPTPLSERNTRQASSNRNNNDFNDGSFGNPEEEEKTAVAILILRLIRRCLLAPSKTQAPTVLFEGDDTQQPTNPANNKFKRLLSLCLERGGDPSMNNTPLRVAAAKLILTVASSPEHCRTLPAFVIRGVLAVASTKEDNLRFLCLEVLRVLLISRTESVCLCNGVKIALEAALDPSVKELCEPLLLAVLHVLSSPHTRKFVRKRHDLQILFSAFTDIDMPGGTERTAKWNSTKHALVFTLRSFCGVIMLTSDPTGLESLMNVIRDETVDVEMQKQVLRVFSSVFRPCTQVPDYRLPKKKDSLLTGASSSSAPAGAGGGGPGNFERTESRFDGGLGGSNPNEVTSSVINLIDSYSALVCVGLIRCGLVKSLTNLCVHENKDVAEQSLTLLCDVMVVASRILPQEFCNEILLMPELTRFATIVDAYSRSADNSSNKATLSLKKKDDATQGSSATDANSLDKKVVDAATKEQQKALLKLLEKGAKASAALVRLADCLNSDRKSKFTEELNVNCIGGVIGYLRTTNLLTKSTDANLAGNRRERLMNELKTAVESGLDKKMFENQLFKSGVNEKKDWTEWSWETIKEILDDSLQNPARLTEALNTKFVKRLGGFFRCSDEGEKAFFAHLAWKPEHALYTQCACRFYQVLLLHKEGKKFLIDDRRGKVFQEIAKELKSAILHVTTSESLHQNPRSIVFDRTIANRFMTREYFAILGRVSLTFEGREFLASHDNKDKDLNFFALFKQMIPHASLDYLTRVVLTNLDYSDGEAPQSREFLKMCSSMPASLSLRLHTVCILRALARSRFPDFDWGISILVGLMRGAESQSPANHTLLTAALSVLNEAAEHAPYLLKIISRNPPFIRNHSASDYLFTKFASHPVGIEFLTKILWIDETIQPWKNERSITHVLNVEATFATTLTAPKADETLPIKIPLNARQAIALQTHPDLFAGKELDLESILRIPWIIECVVNQSKQVTANGKNIVLDTTVDVECRQEVMYMANSNCVVVRGTFVDSTGQPEVLKCSSADILHASLFIGACPVRKNGKVDPPLPELIKQGGGWSGTLGEPSRRGSDAPGRGVASPRSRGIGSVSSDTSERGRAGSAAGGGNELTFDSDDEGILGGEWTNCSLRDAMGDNKYYKIIVGDEVMVCIPGEAAVFYFKKVANNQGREFRDSTSNLCLTKVEYTISLEPRRTFVLPRLHLFGELAKSKEGCEILDEQNVVSEFVPFIGERGNQSADDQFRGAIWAIAHICASPPGLALVEQSCPDFIVWLSNTAYKHPDLSLRGTCVCLLGLVARTEEGRKKVKAVNWDCSSRSSDSGPCVCIPSLLSDFFSPSWEGPLAPNFGGSPTKNANRLGAMPPKSRDKKADKTDILEAVGKLADHITQKEAMSTLEKLRRDKTLEACWAPDGEVVEQIYQMMEIYTLDLRCRRLLYDQLK